MFAGKRGDVRKQAWPCLYISAGVCTPGQCKQRAFLLSNSYRLLVSITIAVCVLMARHLIASCRRSWFLTLATGEEKA